MRLTGCVWEISKIIPALVYVHLLGSSANPRVLMRIVSADGYRLSLTTYSQHHAEDIRAKGNSFMHERMSADVLILN